MKFVNVRYNKRRFEKEMKSSQILDLIQFSNKCKNFVIYIILKQIEYNNKKKKGEGTIMLMSFNGS